MRSKQGDDTTSICINSHPETVVKSITIGTADEIRLVGDYVSLTDEEFKAFLDHFQGVLQEIFENADIEFNRNEHKDSYSLDDAIDYEIGCNLDNTIVRMIDKCWEKALHSFEG